MVCVQKFSVFSLKGPFPFFLQTYRKVGEVVLVPFCRKLQPLPLYPVPLYFVIFHVTLLLEILMINGKFCNGDMGSS